MIFLPASGHAETPWKNGGGITREIAVAPLGAKLDRFEWRVSIAEVGSDGPFSVFPEIDRTLTLLSGDGVLLDVAGETTRLLPGSAPVAFPGDMPAAATLLDGPVTDLNVMSRRGQVAHQLVELRKPQNLTVVEGVLVWISGTGRVAGQAMGPLDALRCETPGYWRIEGSDFLAYYAAFTRL